MSIDQQFTPFSSFIGGLLIGAASFLLLLLNGKIAGISGIIKESFLFQKRDSLWTIFFISGLILGGYAILKIVPTAPTFNYQPKLTSTIVAAICVGVGTYLGNGCTSGHGICGLSRRSKRPLIATLTFMAAGFITMYLMRHLI